MPTRTQTPKRGQPGRFARPAGTSARHPASRRRAAQGGGRPTIVTRRKPQKSGAAKAFEKVGSMLPGTGNGKATSAKSRGGGKKAPAALAVVAGAAGLAFKNRDKLTSMVGGRGKQDDAAPTDTTPPITTGGPSTGFEAGRETPPAGVPSPGGLGDVGNAADASRTDKLSPNDADDRPLGSSGPTPG